MAANANYSSNYPKDDDSFGLGKVPGGVVHVKYGSFTFETEDATELFTLPRGAVVVDVVVRVTTAFDAGTTNTLELGLSGTADAFAASAALGSAAVLRWGASNFVGTGVFADALEVDTPVIVSYDQSGDAAEAGEGYAAVYYIVR
jgi:hypothetical protein